MASSIKFPVPDESGDWREWAKATAQVLQQHLGSANQNPNIGLLVLYKGTPPQGVLPATGLSFDEKKYPSLAKQLGANVTPVVSAPSGYSVGVIAG